MIKKKKTTQHKAIFPITLLFLTMFAGFTIPVDEIKEGWSWAPYISYARWAYAVIYDINDL